ncbi:MAG: M24 family metallopeptidase [Ignavibacteriales bacterium]|nr:MAG: M24 family metallopeptidase [Ignavibacteriales bacterium]
MGKFNLEKIQSILTKANLDAWLFFDFRGSNDLAHNILDIPKERHLTRRFYYFVPREGIPVKIVMGIEAGNLDHLPGEKLKYSSHESLSNHIKNTLKNVKSIAMEYSPFNAIPYVSKVDAGTIEFIKSFGVEIKSSADLISMFAALWTDEQFKDNKPVSFALTDIAHLAFKFIGEQLKGGKSITEYDVQNFIMYEFEKRNYYTDHPPIVGVNENSANPHYAPTSEINKPINKNDFVLIDLWAKTFNPDSVWSDITWTGFAGSSIPEKYIKIFNIVKDARDAAFSLVEKRFGEGIEVRGFEVDGAARNVIVKAGYGEYFIHRTGHSITVDLHGSGAHMDNFETKDERLLLPFTSFSIEPGIYLPGDFGVRSEIDVFISGEGKVIATGGERQKELIAILKD